MKRGVTIEARRNERRGVHVGGAFFGDGAKVVQHREKVVVRFDGVRRNGVGDMG